MKVSAFVKYILISCLLYFLNKVYRSVEQMKLDKEPISMSSVQKRHTHSFIIQIVCLSQYLELSYLHMISVCRKFFIELSPYNRLIT